MRTIHLTPGQSAVLMRADDKGRMMTLPISATQDEHDAHQPTLFLGPQAAAAARETLKADPKRARNLMPAWRNRATIKPYPHTAPRQPKTFTTSAALESERRYLAAWPAHDRWAPLAHALAENIAECQKGPEVIADPLPIAEVHAEPIAEAIAEPIAEVRATRTARERARMPRATPQGRTTGALHVRGGIAIRKRRGSLAAA